MCFSFFAILEEVLFGPSDAGISIFAQVMLASANVFYNADSLFFPFFVISRF